MHAFNFYFCREERPPKILATTEGSAPAIQPSPCVARGRGTTSTLGPDMMRSSRAPAPPAAPWVQCAQASNSLSQQATGLRPAGRSTEQPLDPAQPSRRLGLGTRHSSAAVRGRSICTQLHARRRTARAAAQPKSSSCTSTSKISRGTF